MNKTISKLIILLSVITLIFICYFKDKIEFDSYNIAILILIPVFSIILNLVFLYEPADNNDLLDN